MRDNTTRSTRAVLLSLILVCSVLAGVAGAETTTGPYGNVTGEDFEEYSVGTTSPGGWSGGTIDNTSAEGDRALKFSANAGDVYTNDNTSIQYSDLNMTGTMMDQGDEIQVGVYTDPNNYVRIRLAGGVGQTALSVKEGGTADGTFGDASVSSGTYYNYRLAHEDGQFKMKIWEYGTDEPSSWDRTIDDNGLTGEGRMHTYFSGDGDVGLLDEWQQISPNSQQVTGTVTDTNGNPLSDATVTFENTSSGNTQSTQTDANGEFDIRLLDGTYEVTFSKAGYQTVTETVTIEEAGDIGTFKLEESDLELDFDRYQKPGETQTYQIKWTDENGNEKDVTGDSNLTVSSSNTSILTVSGNELVAAEGVNGTSTINVSYTADDGTVYTDEKNVTVAQPTVENLEILPGIWRFSAVIGDPTFQVMFIGTLVAIVGTRGASAFAGLSLMEMVMVIGFLGGWVGLGMVLVSTFAAIFLGLNLAANIDYSVRR